MRDKVSNPINGEFIGLGHLIRNEKQNKEDEIGYMILPTFWGKGYGSAIAKQLIELAKQTNVNVLKAIIDPQTSLLGRF